MSSSNPLLPYHSISMPSPQPYRHSEAEGRRTRRPVAMPPHWRRVSDFSGVRPSFMQPVLKEIFTTMCMIAFARATLDHQWRILTGDEKDFKEDKERLTKMISAWTVIGSLLLASTSALVTTPPPTPIINYTQRGTYHCLWISFGLMLGGIVAGSIIQVSLSSSTQGYVRYTLMATRYRIWTLLIILSYPSLTIILASGLNTFGLLVAGWNSEDALAKVSCAILLALPIALLVLVLSARKENTDPAKGEVRIIGPEDDAVPVSRADFDDTFIGTRASASAASLVLGRSRGFPRPRSRSA